MQQLTPKSRISFRQARVTFDREQEHLQDAYGRMPTKEFAKLRRASTRTYQQLRAQSVED